MGYCYCEVALPYSQADRKSLRKESHHHDWLFARARIFNKVSQILTPPYSLYFLQRTGFSPPVLVNTEHNGCGITLKASISLPYVAGLSLREKLGQMQRAHVSFLLSSKWVLSWNDSSTWAKAADFLLFPKGTQYNKGHSWSFHGPWWCSCSLLIKVNLFHWLGLLFPGGQRSESW